MHAVSLNVTAASDQVGHLDGLFYSFPGSIMNAVAIFFFLLLHVTGRD